MGWWSNMVARFGPSDSVSSPDGWFVRMLGGNVRTASSVEVTEFTALRFPVVYACVNRIANPVAGFPFKIYQRKGDGAVEVTEHPMSQRLGLRPNDFMSSRTLRKATQAHALLWGNGYQEIERNARGEAVGLWPLLPNNTRPKKLGDELVIQTTIGGKTIDLDHGNVMHIMDLSHDGYVGMSQVGLAREAIGMGLAMEEFGGKFFANDAKSGGFLMHPGRLGPQAHQNLKGSDGRQQAAPENPVARVERQSGLDNAHRVKVLEEGMKFIQTTIPPEDAQFLGSREFQIAEVARMFDVPLVLLQSHEKSTSWGSGIEQLMIGFVQSTIGPWVQATEQEYNFKLFTEEERERGLFVKMNMNAILRGDMAARAQFYKAMFELGTTLNRIHAWEDEPGIGPEGDVSFVSNNVQTIDRAINPPEPAAPPSGVRVVDPDQKEDPE